MRHHRKKSRRTGRDVAPPAGESLDWLDVDPSDRTDKKNYKTLQLCRQAFRTLSVELSGGCGNEVLAGLTVRAVLPAPDATRLLVCLEPQVAGANVPIDVPDLLARLDRVKPVLRREVAAALVRKRAPELEFVIAPPPSAETEVRR